MKQTLLFLLLLIGWAASAQSVYYDSSFNGTGRNDSLVAGIPNSRKGVFNALALQSDGKILGALTYGNTIAVVRLKTNGQRDSTFATNGVFQYNASSVGAQDTRDVVVQPNGSILVLGQIFVSGERENIFLMRLTAVGAPDAAFGNNGVVVTNIPGSNTQDAPRRLFLRPSGKIVVTGLTNTLNNDDRQMLVQYLPNGTLDNNFGTGGIVTKMYNNGAVSLLDAAMQADGKVVGIGVRYNGNTAYAMVSRYDTAGALDNSFDSDGWQQVSVGSYSTSAKGIAVQSNGGIALGLYIPSQLDTVYAMRLTAAGAIDNTFSGTGVLRYRFGTTAGQWSFLERVLTLPGDSLLLGCSAGVGSTQGGYYDYGLLRLKPDGMVDSGWGTNGRVLIDFRNDYDNLYALALQPDGRLVAAGSSRNGDNTTLSYPSIARIKYLQRVAVNPPPPPPPQGLVNQIAEENGLTAFPNPCSGTAILRGTQPETLAVFSSTGVFIQAVVLDVSNGYTAQLYNLATGFYLIRNASGQLRARLLAVD